jgi:phospholipid N-methyltransferase
MALNSLSDVWSKRDRTFLFLVPPEKHARQEALAYELHSSVTVIDWRTEFLRHIEPARRYLSLSVQSELDRLKDLSRTHKGKIVCVINTEYPLMRFNRHERQAFWRGLWMDFPHSDSAIIYTAFNVSEVLPSPVEFEQWDLSGRVLRA